MERKNLANEPLLNPVFEGELGALLSRIESLGKVPCMVIFNRIDKDTDDEDAKPSSITIEAERILGFLKDISQNFNYDITRIRIFPLLVDVPGEEVLSAIRDYKIPKKLLKEMNSSIRAINEDGNVVYDHTRDIIELIKKIRDHNKEHEDEDDA